MRPYRLRILLTLVGVGLLMSCTGTAHRQTAETNQEATDSLDLDFPVTIRHARGLRITQHQGFRQVTILSTDTPTDTLATYILYPRGGVRPTGVGGGQARYIGVPIARLACLTSTELGALALLDLRDLLVGCGSAQYICDSALRSRVASGEVVEISRGMSRHVESLLMARPDVLLQDFASGTDRDADIIAAGIEIVQFNNWKEESLLGRAEWLKLIGVLAGRGREAEEAFAKIEREYEAARALLADTHEVVPIMYGQDYRGAWYVPGEYSYVTSMLEDARMRYEYIAGQVASQPRSFEHVYARHRNARIWLCMMAGAVETVEEFVATNERYRQFEAARSGEIWVDNKRTNEYGANDIWESGIYHPHLILRDLIRIAHPQLLPDYETTYWRRLR